jgi:5S rRNA maturation endonuclease (ribonuclease M5)
MHGVRRVLFGLPELQGQKLVYAVEGERDVLSLRKLGVVATTSAGGAGRWRPEFTDQLRAAGVECVVVLPDNDAPGRAHAETVAQSCHAAGLKVKVVSLPGLPQKADVSDWLAAGHTLEELIALRQNTTLFDPTAHRGRAAPEIASPTEPRPVVVRLADVQPERVMWLWNGRLAAGKLALLVGDPGLGKSWITLDIAARVSAGRVWPDGAVATDPSDVLLLSAEDGVADTIRPRLDALGANVERVHHLAVLRAGEKERAIQLSDAAALEVAVRETTARVLVIDPLSAYLGETDSHRDAAVRGLIAPLAALAERTGVAVLGVMHLSKGTEKRAIYRAIGSIGFIGAARIGLAVAADPERDDRRILAPLKNNLSSPPAALAYTLNDGRLIWEAGPVSDVDVDALLSGPAADRGERREAEQWLRDMLADGPKQSRVVQGAAKDVGFAWRTIERAKQRLGVEAELIGYGPNGRWYWRLADSARETVEAATQENLAVSETDRKKSAPFTGPHQETATLIGVAVSGVVREEL